MGILVGLLCAAIIIPIVLMIAAVILRAAVSISNKIIGPQAASSDYDDDDYDDEYDDDDDDDDDRPRRRRRSRRKSKSRGAIPEPGIGRGMLIVLCAGIVNFAVNFVIGMAVGGGMAAMGGAGAKGAEPNIAMLIAVNAISILVSFFVLAGMCTSMLPTTFGRACLVALFYNLICILIGVIIVVGVMAVGFAALGLK